MRKTAQEHPTIELQQLSNMGLFRSRQGQEYEPLPGDAERDEEDTQVSPDEDGGEMRFSWLEYAIFLVLGIAMLWAW